MFGAKPEDSTCEACEAIARLRGPMHDEKSLTEIIENIGKQRADRVARNLPTAFLDVVLKNVYEFVDGLKRLPKPRPQPVVKSKFQAPGKYANVYDPALVVQVNNDGSAVASFEGKVFLNIPDVASLWNIPGGFVARRNDGVYYYVGYVFDPEAFKRRYNIPYKRKWYTFSLAPGDERVLAIANGVLRSNNNAYLLRFEKYMKLSDFVKHASFYKDEYAHVYQK